MNLIVLGGSTIDSIDSAEAFIIDLSSNISDGFFRLRFIAHIRAMCAFQRAEIYRRSMYNMYTLGNPVKALQYLNMMHREFQIAADWSV